MDKLNLLSLKQRIIINILFKKKILFFKDKF